MFLVVKEPQSQPTLTSKLSGLQLIKNATNTEIDNTKIALNTSILLLLDSGSSSSASSKFGSESVMDDSGSGSGDKQTWPALGVGGEDHRPGPDISSGTFFMKKTRYVYVKYFLNRVHPYKHQHRPPYKTILMV
ncbi:hypothetical protein Hanom_Chr16g01509271 [Helianthus anomalus]